MRRTKEEAEETRLCILKEALRLFAEKGIAATSLADIAKSAGVTRGAIYWHFKNKWDLFDGIWYHYARPIAELGEAIRSDTESDPLGKLRQLLTLLLCGVEQDENIRRLMTIAIRETSVLSDEEMPEQMKALMMDLHQRRVTALEIAMSKGQLPPDLDPQVGALLIKVMTDGLVSTWLRMPGCFSLSERADQFVDSILAVLKHGARQLN